MAQIKLNVIADTSKATANLKTLETQIKGIADNLAKTTTAKGGLTAPLNETGKAAKASAQNVDTLRKSYANLLAQIKTLEKQYGGEIFKGVKKEVDAHLQQIKNLTAADKENSQVLGQLSKDYKKLAADVAQYRAEETKLATADSLIPKTGNTLSRLESGWANLANSIKNVEKYYPKGTFDAIKSQIDEQAKSVAALRAEYNANNKTLSDQSIKTMNDSTAALLEQRAAFDQTKNSATNYHGSLRDLITGFAKFQLSAMLVMKPLQALSSAWQSLNETLVETEKVVVSLQRVLDEDVASGEISSELYAIAQNLGQSFDNVQEIAQNFAKAGLSWQDTLKATEAAVLALNVAELTAEESSEGLIAVMQQFNYEASELTYVIDVLNKAADKSAVDTQELLVALQKTGSYASAANLSLEQTVGLISALSEATAASGQNIGNALKSLFAYSSKSSSLEMFASLSEEMKAVVDMYQIGNASILDVWEKLADTMGNLSDEQADLLEQWSSESGLETELGSALGDVYDQLTGVYDTAGVYRKNYFIALLNNFDEVRNVMDEVADAQGYTNEEQAKYMDTYEAKLNSLQTQWQEFANSEQGLLGFKKGLIDIASWLLNIFDSIGGIRTLLIAIGGVLATILAPKIASFITSLPAKISQFATSLTILNLKLKTTGITVKSLGSALQGIFGVIGVVATVVSTVVGAINSANEAAKQAAAEARQEAIAAWDEVEEEASRLNDLYNDFNALSRVQSLTAEEDDEYKKVQEDIIDLLGERASALNNLTEGTEEYIQKLKELTQAELKEYNDKAQAAATSQFADFKEEAQLLSLGIVGGQYNKIAASAALDMYAGAFGDYFSSGLDEILAAYAEKYGKDSEEYANAINELYAAKESYEEVLKTASSATTSDFIYTHGTDLSVEDIERITDEIIKQYGAGEKYRDTIKGWVIEYSGFNEKVEETNDDLDDQIKKISTLEDESIDKLIDDLKEIRDLEDETAELEEKQLDIAEAKEELAEAEAEAAERLAEAQEKVADAEKSINEERLELIEQQKEAQEELAEAQQDAEEARLDLLEKQQAVLEAQKALEEARNNRSRYVYNGATGQWEWRENQAAIQEAQEELEAAQEAEAEAKEQYENTLQAIKDAETELENINATIADSEKAIEEAIAQGFNISKEILEEQTNIATGVRDAIQSYIEAQQGVEDAKDENEESIANAQENLQNAIDAFNEYIEDQAWDEVISELESGTATNESIKGIIDEWKQTAEEQGATDTSWYEKIVAAIYDSIGVDVTESEESTGSSNTGTPSQSGGNVITSSGGHSGASNLITRPSNQLHHSMMYDSGGVAQGLGYMVKGTAEPESVNDPELTRKILEPNSNAEFSRYVRDMGILFESAREYATAKPVIQNIGGSTTTNNNSTANYSINGVTLNVADLNKPFIEVLRMATMVPTKS